MPTRSSRRSASALASAWDMPRWWRSGSVSWCRCEGRVEVGHRFLRDVADPAAAQPVHRRRGDPAQVLPVEGQPGRRRPCRGRAAGRGPRRRSATCPTRTRRPGRGSRPCPRAGTRPRRRRTPCRPAAGRPPAGRRRPATHRGGGLPRACALGQDHRAGRDDVGALAGVAAGTADAERVAQRVADQAEGGDRQDDGQAGPQQQPRRGVDVLEGVAEHPAPAGLVGRAEAEELQPGLDDDRDAQQLGHLDDGGRDDHGRMCRRMIRRSPRPETRAAST